MPTSMPGDMIIVNTDKEPAIGDKVVSLNHGNERTLKTLRYDEKWSTSNHLLEDVHVDELTFQRHRSVYHQETMMVFPETMVWERYA